MTDSPSSKRQRVDESPVVDIPVDVPERTSKYPFVDYDAWTRSIQSSHPSITVIGSGIKADTHAPSSAAPSVRPVPVWYSLGGDTTISKECISAQHSSVAHSPFVTDSQSTDGENPISLYVGSQTSLSDYIAFRETLPDQIHHPYYASPEFAEAQIADVISSAIKRNPAMYSSTWPAGMFGVAHGASNAGLAVARTESFDKEHLHRLPWTWELDNRHSMVAKIVEAIDALGTKGDLVVPCHGLVCLTWFAGILFRLSQLFYKVTIARSQVSPRWDDSFFVFCQGRRPPSKMVDKPLKQLRGLLVDGTGGRWGYSVPPVCFRDPALVAWLQSANAQLMGTLRPGAPTVYSHENYPSLEKLATQHRLKKFIFPTEFEHPVQIGFYFGSFNPIHENHVALAEFAHTQLGIQEVFLVPNQDGNKEKDNANETVVPLSDRIEMIRARLGSIDWLHVMEPTGRTYRWEAKAEMAETKVAAMFEESRKTGQSVLLVGQDSWNKAVMGSSRDKTTRHFIGIAKIVKSKIVVFPRTGMGREDDPVQGLCNAPKPIRELMSVAEGYVDPIEGLSSSKIRAELTAGVQAPIGLHPAVVDVIRANNLYSACNAS